MSELLELLQMRNEPASSLILPAPLQPVSVPNLIDPGPPPDDDCQIAMFGGFGQSLALPLPLQPIVVADCETAARRGILDPCRDELAICELVDCDASLFEVYIYPRIDGLTWITWDASAAIDLPARAYATQAQVEFSRAGVDDPLAWTVIEPFRSNKGIYVDDDQRVFGTESNLHYRITIRDAEGRLYRSKPAPAQGDIPRRWRATYNEVIRRWKMRARIGDLRIGYLLKRIRYGARCSDCRDRDGGSQIRSDCPVCYGVGYEHGYYQAPGCSYAEMGKVTHDVPFDPNRNFYSDSPLGTLKLLNIPQLYPGDVWVERNTDHRFELGAVEHGQKIGGQELVTSINFRRLDFTHIVYTFPVEQLV